MSNLVAPIIERFGGIRPMASKLGIHWNTVQNWKRTGWLPPQRVDLILKAAEIHEVDVSRDELIAAVMAKQSAA